MNAEGDADLERLISAIATNALQNPEAWSGPGCRQVLARIADHFRADFALLACSQRSGPELPAGDVAVFGQWHDESRPSLRDFADALGPAMSAAMEAGAGGESTIVVSGTSGRDLAGLVRTQAEFGVSTSLWIPLTARGRLVGLLALATTHPACGSTEPSRDALSSVAGVLANWVDRETAMQAVVASEERMRTLFEAAPVSLWEQDWSGMKRLIDELRGAGVEDLRGAIAERLLDPVERGELCKHVGLNKQMLAMYGAVSREEIFGDDSNGRWTDAFNKLPELVTRLADGEGRVTLLGTSTRANGEPFPMRTVTQLADSDANDWSRVYVAAVDVSEELGAIRKLESREAQFRDLVEGSIQGIYVHDTRKVLFANQACARIFGYDSPDDLYALDTVFRLNAPHEVEWMRALGAARLRGEPARSEYYFDGHRRDGSFVRLHMMARTVMWEGIQANQCVVVDISARQRAEDALREMNEALERKVEERTSDLAAANAQLRELDQLKSMFIASMSHELRTPLNAIIGFTGIILQGMSGTLNDTQHEQLERVNGAARHLLDLISDVIDISKIEAGMVDVFPEPVELVGAIEEAVASVRVSLEAKQLTLETEAPARLELVTDRRRLVQCLLNLVSNAVKYTERGGVRVSVSSDDESATVIVADTGIGIAGEDMQRLFQPFERLNSRLRIGTPGTGLGLYLTRKIACELLHGDVSVESEAERGSTFTLMVPLHPPAGPPESA